ncbi:MAG: nitroreductase/quinone reductase family protein [Gammaproteobacteria bacterium]
MTKELEKFRQPSRFEHWFNALVALLAKFGITFRDGYRLLVAGRKSGKIYSVAVTVPTIGSEKFLVAPRGETQWVRNARAAGEVNLEKGALNDRYVIEEIFGEKKNQVLAEYLNRYQKAVQRYFPVSAGAAPQQFEAIADAFPVFVLRPVHD